LEAEVNPVMAKLIEAGIEITAVHNHLLRANPAPFYVHVGGHGDAVKLAMAIRDALAESKTPLEAPAVQGHDLIPLIVTGFGTVSNLDINNDFADFPIIIEAKGGTLEFSQGTIGSDGFIAFRQA
jgi:hypothetical protein